MIVVCTYILANWNWWCIEIRQWMGILLLLNWLCTQNKIYWRMPFERCKFKWLIDNSLRRYTEKEGLGDVWWALHGVFLDFIHQAGEKVRRVDCSTPPGSPSGRGKRHVRNVEPVKAEAVAIHREATPNDDIGWTWMKSFVSVPLGGNTARRAWNGWRQYLPMECVQYI